MFSQFLQKKKQSSPPLIESEEVKKFLDRSYAFQKLTQIYNKCKTEDINDVNHIVKSINGAITFDQILFTLDRFNPEIDAINLFEVKLGRFALNTIGFFAGYVDDRVNVAYYAAQLRENTVDKMVELGLREKKYHLSNYF